MTDSLIGIDQVDFTRSLGKGSAYRERFRNRIHLDISRFLISAEQPISDIPYFYFLNF